MSRMPAWLANLLLALLATALALWLADLAFRAYERSQLLPRLPDAEGQGPVNLGALRYNEGLVPRQAEVGEFRILSFGDSFLDPSLVLSEHFLFSALSFVHG